MSEREWRLMVHGPAAGAWNMAVDEALLEGIAAGTSAPTLRFYRWAPACLSLGYFQRFEVADRAACAALGVDIVRRPTGGRAILHDAELTYSLALPAGILGLDAGILPSYYRISRALQAGIAALGVTTTMAPESAAPAVAEHGPACFDRPSAHEILLDDRKLVGSAQVRRGAAILQHGSILIQPRIERLVACLRSDAQAPLEAPRLRSSVVGLAEVGIENVGALTAAIARAFGREFDVLMVSGSLTACEAAAAMEYVELKYGSREWTERAMTAGNTTRTR